MRSPAYSKVWLRWIPRSRQGEAARLAGRTRRHPSGAPQAAGQSLPGRGAGRRRRRLQNGARVDRQDPERFEAVRGRGSKRNIGGSYARQEEDPDRRGCVGARWGCGVRSLVFGPAAESRIARREQSTGPRFLNRRRGSGAGRSVSALQ